MSNKEDKNKDKSLSQEEAQQVAAKTKKKFPVFTSITPRNEGGKWVYDWTGSNGTKKTPLTIDDMSEEWEASWKMKQAEVNEKMQKFVPKFKDLDPNAAEIRIRGSIASGVKLNPRKKDLNGKQYIFDPTDFDIDAYVVSQRLFDGAKGKTFEESKRGQVSGKKNPAVFKIIKEMSLELGLIVGNRDTGAKTKKFDVYIRVQKNAEKTVRKDQEAVKKLTLDESRGNPLIIK